MTTIDLAIEELTQEIAMRQDALRSLQLLRLPQKCEAKPEAQPKQRANSKPTTSTPQPARSGGRSSLTARVLEAAASCPEPFDQNTIARLIGRSVTPLQVRGALAHVANSGRLKVVETGGPGRPSKFALASEASAKRVTIPGLDREEGSLESKLETALKERDQAVGAGNETLARILQDKVDDLQRRLNKVQTSGRKGA